VVGGGGGGGGGTRKSEHIGSIHLEGVPRGIRFRMETGMVEGGGGLQVRINVISDCASKLRRLL